MRWLEVFGAKFETLCMASGRYPLMLLEVLRRLRRPPWFIPLIVQQSEQVGVQSLPVVLLTATFTGMVLALQSYTGFHRFGAESMTGTVVSLSIVRELGPVLVGLMVAGRVGASFAAEIGAMRVSEQIDALWTLSTDPVRYLIMPRLFAAILMLPLLVAVADVLGIFGGYAISVSMLGQNSQTYLDHATAFVQLSDMYSGLFKAIFFGGIIGLVSCTEGFYCKGGAQGVGRATTHAVVLSSMSILVTDYLLTALFLQ